MDFNDYCKTTKFENTTKTNCAQTQNTNTSAVKNQQIQKK